jgi:hypothetical protein
MADEPTLEEHMNRGAEVSVKGKRKEKRGR